MLKFLSLIIFFFYFIFFFYIIKGKLKSFTKKKKKNLIKNTINDEYGKSNALFFSFIIFNDIYFKNEHE